MKVTKQKPSARGWVIGAVLFVIVALAAVVAIALGGGDDGETTVGADGQKVEVEQTRPVTVAGTPLAEFPGNGEADPAVGQKIPVLSGQDFAGETQQISPGKKMMLVFVAHWCPHCQVEVPLLAEWVTAGGLPAGVTMEVVATGTDRAAPNYPPSAWLDEEGLPGTFVDDGKSAGYPAAQAYGLTSYPYIVFVNSDGTVSARLSGEQPVATIEAEIAKLT